MLEAQPPARGECDSHDCREPHPPQATRLQAPYWAFFDTTTAARYAQAPLDPYARARALASRSLAARIRGVGVNRRNVRFAVFLVLVGCFDPAPRSGIPCTSASTCPDGLWCYDQVCLRNAPIDAEVDPPADALVDSPADAALPDAPRCMGFAPLPSLSAHLYVVSTVDLSWNEAVTSCSIRGGYLAIPDDDAEAVAIVATHNNETWVGLSDQLTEGTWITVTGSTSFYARWMSGEPNNGGDPSLDPGQDCAQLYVGGAYDDDYCDEPKPFVCECEP
ncbi:MAG: lectin-like protein [Kofleriaceae bacterium]